jgi:hypothetical protein
MPATAFRWPYPLIHWETINQFAICADGCILVECYVNRGGELRGHGR